VDSGSLGDFISSMLADQLKVRKKILSVPLGLQLVVQGSQSKINTMAEARIQYQGIDNIQHFNVINLNNYDIILETPWLYQHKVCIGFNPAQIIIGQDKPELIQSGHNTKLMVHALSTDEKAIETARSELQCQAKSLCWDIDKTDLPPFQAINHTIPLINGSKIYPW
jgi:calcineurin-like phosphoesterase family protein